MQYTKLLLALTVVAVCTASTTYNKGDVTLYLRNDVATTLKTFIDDEGSCPANTSALHKRAPDLVRCLDNREIYYNIDVLLAGLRPEAENLGNQVGGVHIPVFIDPALQQRFAEMIRAAEDWVPTVVNDVSEYTLAALALIAFTSTFAVIFLSVQSLAVYTIRASYFQMGQELYLQSQCPFPSNDQLNCDSIFCKGTNGHCTKPHLFSMCPCKLYRCPRNDYEDYLCPKECGGDDGTGKCKGLSDGKWKGCPVAKFPARSFNPPPISGPNPKCNGIATNTWVSEAVVQKAINTFCSDPGNLGGYRGARTVHEYDPGTLDDIRLTIDFPQTKFMLLSNKQCQSNFANIISRCDVDPANPQNFKHGGIYTDPLGPVMTIEPLAGDPVLQCDPPDPPNGLHVAMTRDGLVASINDFCSVNSGKDLKTALYTEYAPDGPSSKAPAAPALQMIRLHASRPGVQSQECANWNGILQEPECLRAFMALTDKCNSNTNLGKRGGSTYFECIDFKIEGSGGADWYRLHLHEEMSGTQSSVTWTVYDSRGHAVGGPGTGPHPTGAPYDVGYLIDAPTFKNDTNIHLAYPATRVNGPKYIGLRYMWSTGWIGGGEGSQYYSKHYYCDDVLDPARPSYWVPYGAGFARDFDCYFVGWAQGEGLAFLNYDHTG